MTREEAITHLLHDWHINLGCEFAIKPGRLDDFLTALDVALTALRFPTREMVERMRGEWIGDDEERVETIDGSPVKSATCSNCGNWLVGSDEYSCAGHFCPSCGAPMTDEAVEMVAERLEALKDGSTTD